MAALAFALPGLAAADLYRWVDPASGSVKLSNTPPPWYERGDGPAVERIPYAGPAAAPRPPGKDAAPQANAVLQARWRGALALAAAQPSKQNLDALGALALELDRIDPSGTPRRREEASAMLSRLQQK